MAGGSIVGPRHGDARPAQRRGRPRRDPGRCRRAGPGRRRSALLRRDLRLRHRRPFRRLAGRARRTSDRGRCGGPARGGRGPRRLAGAPRARAIAGPAGGAGALRCGVGLLAARRRRRGRGVDVAPSVRGHAAVDLGRLHVPHDLSGALAAGSCDRRAVAVARLHDAGLVSACRKRRRRLVHAPVRRSARRGARLGQSHRSALRRHGRRGRGRAPGPPRMPPGIVGARRRCCS